MIPMHMRFLLIVVFGTVLVPFENPAKAQAAPTPPYLAPVPERLHWIVNFSYIQKAAPGTPPAPPPPTNPVTIETTKVGTTRRIVVKSSDGSTRQFDIIGKDCYTQLPALGLQALKLRDYVPFPYFDLGFSFTGCVNHASYRDYTTYQGIPVFHYQDGSTEAWISVETKLPIGADQIGSVKTTYQYLPAPDAIILTPEEQKSLEMEKRAADIFKNLR
jgi:hypothetical protein